MDTTRIDDLLSELEEVDPADAPEVADTLAEELASSLDAPPPEDDPEKR
ncbi:MAG: hypothetical protein ACE5KX_05880 [Acidimicrobiia bacterium]